MNIANGKFTLDGKEYKLATNNDPGGIPCHLHGGVKGFDPVNETLDVDNGGQPQQMALHQAVVVTYKGPSPAQLAAVSNAVAQPSSVAGAPGAGGPGNLTPEQVEAFRQSMRDKFSKGRGPDNSGDPRQRGGDTTGGKTPKTPTAAPETTKPPKTPKVR